MSLTSAAGLLALLDENEPDLKVCVYNYLPCTVCMHCPFVSIVAMESLHESTTALKGMVFRQVILR